ncbi:hypothetical protein WISP_111177 [Willisornis vidua]|uniref:WDR63 protein n=1 Tax=Willisornis vidua TaxID=1566151 RepID=A0ABQ9D164_9PASS|nr:hypothetical protein WISP_111177 [Willisornis vidua]
MSKNLTSSKTSLKGQKTSPKKQKGASKTKESSKGKGKQHGENDEVDLSMASIGHPEIFPLVLTAKTQEIFNCRIDEDVTEENCFKLIKKEDIIQDLKTRADISDFYPFRKVVLEYPGEELLVVFDAKFQYGQDFYIVASEEAKENLIKPPETAEEEKEDREDTLEVHPFKPIVPKPWISLGSEKEVEEESVKDTVRKIKYKISRVRRKFGAPIAFTDKNASQDKDYYVECTSYEDKTFSIQILERDVGVQVVPKVRAGSTQTKWTYPKNAATQYSPRQLSQEEKAENLSSERMKEFLTSVQLRMEIALQQNEIMNAFFDDWMALAEDKSSSDGKPDVFLKACQSFADPQYLKDRTITCVCRHPTICGIIAVSARKQLSYEEHDNLSNKSLLHQSVILFWSFFDPIHPQLMLECPGDIYCFQFSPNHPNIIAGGCINGQVVLWDISQHEKNLQTEKSVTDEISDSDNEETAAAEAATKPPLTQVQQSSTEPPLVTYCAVSSIEYSHKRPVTDIQWLPAIEHQEKPSYEKVNKEKKLYMAPGVPDTSKPLDLCWKPLIKDGVIGYFDWKIDNNSAKPVSQKQTQKYALHTETINTLQRSPFFKDIFLSIGGQNFAIWKEGVTHANVLDYFEREVKYLKYCEQEFQEYQKFQAKTELKWSWKHRERKQKQEMEEKDNCVPGPGEADNNGFRDKEYFPPWMLRAHYHL